MGMLMHHTWLEEQKKKAAPKGRRVEEPVKEEPEAEPVKKAATGRRKTSK